MQNKLVIGKKEYLVEEKDINHSELCFYSENPRIYSVLDAENENPTQEIIEETLSQMDHVKQLKISILANGGLIDPIIVRDGDYVVLEGNSRLAAYRLLSKNDPIKWGRIKCKVLPKNISEAAIFTLLGQYHIIGRKDWSPYEQAGYLYRKKMTTGEDIKIISEELGLASNTAKQYVEIYSFMKEHNELKQEKWSYYEEYLKNQGIKNYRKTFDRIDAQIVKKIKNGEIRLARDIRSLGYIAKSDSKVARRLMGEIIDGKIDLYSAYERFEESGKTGHSFLILNKFRKRIREDDFKKDLANEKQDVVLFELKKIRLEVEKIIKTLEN